MDVKGRMSKVWCLGGAWIETNLKGKRIRDSRRSRYLLQLLRQLFKPTAWLGCLYVVAIVGYVPENWSVREEVSHA